MKKTIKRHALAHSYHSRRYKQKPVVGGAEPGGFKHLRMLDPAYANAATSGRQVASAAAAMEGAEVVRTATCGCCGIGEECTVRYVAWVEAQFGGVWVCGLCAEAIKDEMARRGAGLEAAMRVHANFIRIAAAADPGGAQIARSLLQLLKRVIASAAAAHAHA